MNSYRVYNNYYWVFFVVYLLVVSYFFLNLFTGIIFKYFNDACSREQKVIEDDKKHKNIMIFFNKLKMQNLIMLNL